MAVLATRSAGTKPVGHGKSGIIGVALLLTATAAWGGMFPVAKHALTVLDPIYITLIRYASVAAILIVILIAREGIGSLHPRGHASYLFINGSLGFAGFNLLALYGLSHTRPEKAAIFLALVPLLTACIKWSRNGARPTPVTWGCIVVALAGVSLVVSAGNLSLLLSGKIGGGDLAIFAGVVCWSIYTLSREGLRTWFALRYTCLTTAFGSLTLLILAIGAMVSGVIPMPNTQILIAVQDEMLYLILVAGVVAVYAWNEGIHRLGAVNGALFMNIVPVTAFLIEIIRGWHPPFAEVFGALLVIGALVTNNLLVRHFPVIKTVPDGGV